MWKPDVAWSGYILCHPCAMGWSESVAEFHWRQVFVGAHKVGPDSEDHGCFPFTGVTHLVLVECGVDFVGFGAEKPISAKKEQQVLALAMLLAQFEDGLASGHIISAVAVDEDDSPKA